MKRAGTRNMFFFLLGLTASKIDFPFTYKHSSYDVLYQVSHLEVSLHLLSTQSSCLDLLVRSVSNLKFVS